MKYKVSTLEGALLDAAVARAQGWETGRADGINWWWSVPVIDRHNPSNAEAAVAKTPYDSGYRPSIDWLHGGPIIDRELITTDAQRGGGREWWRAWVNPANARSCAHSNGPTPLIAAMRAYCASKFGEEVELP